MDVPEVALPPARPAHALFFPDLGPTQLSGHTSGWGPGDFSKDQAVRRVLL
jgi:hypothetical protein